MLEVGCCGGTTTSIIGKHCRLVVGIDQTAAEIAIANRRFALAGKVRFEVMDAFDMAAVLRLQKDIGCDAEDFLQFAALGVVHVQVVRLERVVLEAVEPCIRGAFELHKISSPS